MNTMIDPQPTHDPLLAVYARLIAKAMAARRLVQESDSDSNEINTAVLAAPVDEGNDATDNNTN